MLRKAIAVLLSATFVVAGCGTPAKVDEAQVVGTWCGNDGDELKLEPGKTFSLRQISAKYGDYVFGADRPATGTGTWTFSAGSTSAKVSLRFTSPAGVVTSLGAPKKDLLVVWFTDPDSGYDYSFKPCATSALISS